MADKKRKRHPGGKRGKTWISPKQQQAFLDTLAEGWSLTKAAKVAEVPRKTITDLRDHDETFRLRVEAAMQAGIDCLEDAAVTRGVEGWLEPVFQQGRQVGQVRKFSDTMLAMQLNGRAAEKYRAPVQSPQANEIGVSFRLAMSQSFDLLEQARKRALGHSQASRGKRQKGELPPIDVVSETPALPAPEVASQPAPQVEPAPAVDLANVVPFVRGVAK